MRPCQEWAKNKGWMLQGGLCKRSGVAWVLTGGEWVMWDKVGQGGDQCKELATSKESLNSSLAYSLPSKKDFEGEVSKPNDDLVAVTTQF